MVSVSVNAEGLKACMTAAKSMPGKAKRGMSRGINRAKTAIQNAAVKETTSRYYVKKSKLRSEMKVKATKTKLNLIVRGRRHNIASYKLSPKKPKTVQARGYTLKGGVRRGVLRTITPSNTNNKPFLMPVHGGEHYIAVVRAGRERLPVMSIVSPAYAQLVRWAELYNREIVKAVQEEMSFEMYHEFRDWIGGTEERLDELEDADTVMFAR